MFRHARNRILAIAACSLICAGPRAGAIEGMPAGEGDYASLVALYDEFLAWQDEARAKRTVPNRDIAGAAAERYPDYGDAAVDARCERMRVLQDRLENMNVVDWPLAQQVDYLAVRSRFDRYDFTLNVSRPWSRDPGWEPSTTPC